MPFDRLTGKVEQYAKSTGLSGQLIATSLPDLNVFSRNDCTVLEATLYQPVFCLILQGKKETILGENTIKYGRGDSLVVSHDLPVTSRVTQASVENPYLALVFHLDLGILRGLDSRIGPNGNAPGAAASIALHEADTPLIDALERYFDLMNNPAEVQVLAPLIREEIHFRLLLAPYGAMLRSMANRHSHASRIEQAIGVIRQNFRSALLVPELAQRVGMSVSSFHEHFKSVTQTTPLRYQKDLRLMEAKRLLSEGGQSVSTIAYDVGYESPNQFSREYARKFGVSPHKDAKRGVTEAA